MRLRVELYPADLNATLNFYVHVLDFDCIRDERRPATATCCCSATRRSFQPLSAQTSATAPRAGHPWESSWSWSWTTSYVSWIGSATVDGRSRRV